MPSQFGPLPKIILPCQTPSSAFLRFTLSASGVLTLIQCGDSPSSLCRRSYSFLSMTSITGEPDKPPRQRGSQRSIARSLGQRPTRRIPEVLVGAGTIHTGAAAAGCWRSWRAGAGPVSFERGVSGPLLTTPLGNREGAGVFELPRRNSSDQAVDSRASRRGSTPKRGRALVAPIPTAANSGPEVRSERRKTLYLPRNRRGKGRQSSTTGRPIQGARAPHRVQAPYPPCPSVRRTNGNIPTPWRATVRPVTASLPLVARRNPTRAASSSFRVLRS